RSSARSWRGRCDRSSARLTFPSRLSARSAAIFIRTCLKPGESCSDKERDGRSGQGQPTQDRGNPPAPTIQHPPIEGKTKKRQSHRKRDGPRSCDVAIEISKYGEPSSFSRAHETLRGTLLDEVNHGPCGVLRVDPWQLLSV